MNWFSQIMLALVFLVPSWLAVGFFRKSYQMSSEVFVIWYYLGIIITATWTVKGSILPSIPGVMGVLLTGLTIGACGNLLVFRSVAGAPNPGLPIAISNSASVFIFLLAVLLYRWFPSRFEEAQVDWWSLVGIALTVVGVGIIALRR